METEPSSDTFAAFSDPVSDDFMNSADSEDTYHLIINQCLQILDAAEEEVHQTRVLQPSVPIPQAPQIQLLDKWWQHNPRRFHAKLCVEPEVYDWLISLIEVHDIFASDRQLPVATQLAIFLNCAGHYSNGLTIENIGNWAGVSAGSVHNCCNSVMIALLGLHDVVLSWDPEKENCAADMEKAKQWVASKTCPEWQNGYLTGDGTCILLFQKPGEYGEVYFDKKKNYSVNCQVHFLIILISKNLLT